MTLSDLLRSLFNMFIFVLGHPQLNFKDKWFSGVQSGRI